MKFKIRASAIHNIMAPLKNQITEAQLAKIAELEARDKALTPKMQETYDELVAKKNHIPTYKDLPDGAVKYAESWVKNQLYKKSRIYLSNKFTEKGVTVEDDIIKYLNPAYTNNKEQFENEWITGEPDIIIKKTKTLRDVKSSWDYDTFPLFEKELPNKDYYWQGLGYMDLLGYKKYFVDYVLSDTPEYLIEKEYWKEFGVGPEEPIQLAIAKKTYTTHYKEFRKDYLYNDTSRELRIKTFEVKYDSEAIQSIHDRVELIRELIKNEYDKPNQSK